MKSNSNLVHYRIYQCPKKGKQVTSSTKRGLRYNVVLQLMKCLTPTVSLIYLWITISYLFVFLSVSNMRANGVFNKNRLRNTLSSGTKSCKKRKVATLNSAAHIN